MKTIRQKLEEKINSPGIIKRIVGNLSNSEMNSFYLELFNEQSGKIKPSDLLRQFSQNRFTVPAPVDIISYKLREIEWLKSAEENEFKTILLSPLTPFGSSSAVGFVNQNNVVSAARNTEVISDATNTMALLAANELKTQKTKRTVRYSSTHRHTRAQHFDNPAFTAHFGAFCMISCGIDSGSFSFEAEELSRHLKVYLNMLHNEIEEESFIKVYFKNEERDFSEKILETVKDISGGARIITGDSDETRNYYEMVRIKIFVIYKGQEFHIVDMGFVSWGRKLLNNEKQRMLISGCGLELLYKIKEGLI